MGLISLWRRTLEPTDLRVELRVGALAMGYFDTRQLALDWLTQHVADEEDRISEQLSEIADEQESVQGMREFLTDAEEQEPPSLADYYSEPYTEQERYDHEHPPLRDDPMETER